MPPATLAALLALAPVAAALEQAPAPREEALEVWTARLASDSAAERQRAERWLAANLATDDYPELARAAQRGDAEVRRRLRTALASEDRHLALACLLLAEERRELVELGAAAFEELVLRWSPDAAEAPTERGEVLAALARSDTARHSLAPAVEPAVLALERLDRLGDLALPLVIAPELRDRAPQPRGALEGTATRLLAELARLDSATIVGVGDFSGDEPGPGAWVHVSTLGSAYAGDAIGWLRRWCQNVEGARGPDGAAAAAARALAATGWPAALAWLEGRWLSRRDENALSGLLYAAERGRVAPGLTLPGERREVLARADEALATPGSERRAERAARALAAAGAASPTGEDPALELIEGFETLPGGPRWVRLVALEGTRSAHPRVLALLAGLVREPGLAPALRLQALRALAAVPPEAAGEVAARPVELGALLDHALAAGRARELAGLLTMLGDPFEPARAAGLDREPPASARALFALELAYLARRPEAARLLARALAAGAGARPALRELVGGWVRRDGPGPAAAVVEAAAAGLDPEARAELERFGALCGSLAPERQVQLHGALAARAELSEEDLLLLGALAAGPRGTSARARLLAQLPEAGAREARELGPALDRAAAELRRAFQDAAFDEFVAAARAAVDAPGHPLRVALRAPGWPPPVLPPARPLELSDRRLPEGG